MSFGVGASRLLTIGLLLAAVVPATASADASSNIRRAPGDSAAFTLAGSNGYSLYFKSEKGQLTIIASRRRPAQPTIAPSGKLLPARLGASSESTYVVRGVSHDPSTVEADLGTAGEVSLSFEPNGKKRVTMIDLAGHTEKCIGATKVVRRLGNFVGSVSFRGENGYTTAEAASVPGTVGTSTFRNCSHYPQRAGDKPGRAVRPERPTFLAVSAKEVSGSLLAIRDSETAGFIATGFEELGGGLIVVRTATAEGRPSLFSVGPQGRRATVRPPAPFSGVGVYRDPPAGPPTWSGDLNVSFPGVRQPLTGAGREPVLQLPGS
jgi:hypothetical protein